MSGLASPADAAPASVPALQSTPSIKRRLAAFLYEGVLLFGVLMFSALPYSALTGMHNAIEGQAGLKAFLFIVLGVYFGWFWTHSGQTVAMKAWHVRLVDTQGQPVTYGRAVARYVLSYLWFMPALLAAYLSGLKGAGSIFGIILAGVATYAALARLHPQRQFWHDVVCGTRLIEARPAPKKAKAA